MTSWREERRAVERVERVTVPELHALLERNGAAVQVVDVRERTEWDAGHIPGSLHVPYHDLHDLPGGLDATRPVAVICASGQRSAIGASLLRRAGASEVLHVVDGGVGTWERAGHPIER
jgi:rhodanese-related sulfurtransferase